MKLIPAEEREIPLLTEISKAAFDSDVSVGAAGPGGPSGYDSCAWHKRMLEEGHLLAAVEGDRLLGGAIVFGDQSDKVLYVCRQDLYRPGIFSKRLWEKIDGRTGAKLSGGRQLEPGNTGMEPAHQQFLQKAGLSGNLQGRWGSAVSKNML